MMRARIECISHSEHFLSQRSDRCDRSGPLIHCLRRGRLRSWSLCKCLGTDGWALRQDMAGHGMTWHDMAPHNSRAAVWSQTFPLSLWSLWIQCESLIMFDHARRCQAKLRSWRNLLSWKGYSNIVSIKLVLHVVAVAPCWSMLHLSDIIYRILILSFAFFCLSKKSHRRSQVSDHLPAEDLSRAE